VKLQILLILGVAAAAGTAMATPKGLVAPPGEIRREQQDGGKAYPPPPAYGPWAYPASHPHPYAQPAAPKSLTGSTPTSPTQPWSATAPKGFKPCNNSLVYGACDHH